MIAQGHITNFETLKRAFNNDDVALMECEDAVTKQPVVVLCMVSGYPDNITMVPVAKFFDGNPYEQLIPPDIKEAA